MKHSLKNQLFVTMLFLLVVVLGSNFLLNNFLLEHYYVMNKKNILIDIYNLLDQRTDETDYQTEEFEELFQQISDNYNLEIVLLSSDDMGQFHTIYESRNNMIMRGRVEGYLFGFDSHDDVKEILVSNDAYTIEKISDSFANNEYLESFGMLTNGCVFLMRIALQSIKDSAAISNRFSAYILLVGLLVSLLLIWWISERITKPIKELTNISEHMANLEFNIKYNGKGTDEIGKLGDNFNHMSSILEKTISELKTANNELQNDLVKRRQIEEMRKDFLSNITHELKTPIALIQGYAEGLEECINDDPESRAFYCEVIVDEASKMNNMVKKMLSLNHLESGNDITKIERFDLCELLRGVIQSVAYLAEQKGAVIENMVTEKQLFVWGDEFKIEEVITNYLSNAVNHVDGDMKISVSVNKMDEKVRVIVYNTGKQIPENELNNIWIKFYKVDKARTREYGGSGIGLSIVKAIMDSHHQAFGVENVKDGVAFWFELDCSDKGDITACIN